MLSFLKNVLIFSLLTVLTQVGGLVYLLYKPLGFMVKKSFKNKLVQFLMKGLAFLIFYLVIATMVIPIFAIPFGRVPMPMFSDSEVPLKPRTVLTCLTNRHYVKLELRAEISRIAKEFSEKHPNTEVLYLDANFPFLNGFPLIPHLSHNDGEKLDLEFFYKQSTTNEPTNSSPSWIGYGSFEGPKKGETDQPDICRKRGFWQYDLTKYLNNEANDAEFELDEKKTADFIRSCASSPLIKKIFLEPHLKSRFGLSGLSKVRFHGCHAVRHDDHIHIQL